jgi:hypothetical protein
VMAGLLSWPVSSAPLRIQSTSLTPPRRQRKAHEPIPALYLSEARGPRLIRSRLAGFDEGAAITAPAPSRASSPNATLVSLPVSFGGDVAGVPWSVKRQAVNLGAVSAPGAIRRAISAGHGLSAGPRAPHNTQVIGSFR